MRIHLHGVHLRMRFGEQCVLDAWRGGRHHQLIIDLLSGNIWSSAHDPHASCAWSMTQQRELRPSHDALGTFVAALGRNVSLAVRAFSNSVLRNLDPVALRVARTLNPRLRLRAYARLVRSPRLQQLTLAHPSIAALAFWSLHSREESAAAARAFLSGIDAGRSLRTLTRDLLQANISLGPGSLNRHLLLLRRAPADLWPMTFCQGTPAAFVPEDIPALTRHRTLWYRLMLDSALWHRDATQPGVVSLARFTSRHWAEIHRSRIELGSLLEYARASGDLPDRERCPRRWLEAAARWFRQLLPPSLSVEARGDTWQVIPLRTPREIAAEGRRQFNCLGKPSPLQQHFFAAVVGERRLSVSVNHCEDGFHLGQVLAARNRDPTDAERQVIEQWFAAATAPSVPAPS